MHQLERQDLHFHLANDNSCALQEHYSARYVDSTDWLCLNLHGIIVENSCFGRGWAFYIYYSSEKFTSRYLATSAVDLDTDRAIQEIIRGPAFADVTIFTIALVVLFFLCLVHVIEKRTTPDIDSTPLSSQTAS